MAMVSQRRDMEDPAVIRNFSGQVQNQENLRMLTLHTFADSLATSDKLWNGFKDSLLWELHHKSMKVLSGSTDFIRAEARQRELLQQEVTEMLPRNLSEEEVHAHFGALPNRYFDTQGARDIVLDLTLTHRFMHNQLAEEDKALEPVVAWHNEPDRGYTTVKICTWDRAGLFSKIAGSFAAAGINILNAQIFTRNDGIVLDTFCVTDARAGNLVNRGERELFESTLGRALLRTGRFLTFLPGSFLRLSGEQLGFKALPIDLPIPPRPVGIVTLRNRTLSPLAALFIDCARRLASPLRQHHGA